MVDIHSHILPGIDDGAATPEISVSLLHKMFNQGVEIVVATPHFYPENESVEQFKKRRDISFNVLKKYIDMNDVTDIPEIRMGSEVHLSSEIYLVDDFKPLLIENTDFALLELPYDFTGKWISEMIFNIMGKFNINPIIAHIERYMLCRENYKCLEKIFEMNLPMQVNANSFLNFRYRKILDHLIEKNHINVIAGDSHNLNTRSVNISKAISKIKRKYGEEFVKNIIQNSYDIADNVFNLY